MIYHTNISTPVGKDQSDPKSTELKLTKGLVYKFALFFPPGSNGLMGVRILEKGVSIYPRNREYWFKGSNVSIEFDDTYFIGVEPYIWEILTYNDDTAYAHEVAVSVGIVSGAEYTQRYLPFAALQALLTSVEARAAEREVEPTPEDYLSIFAPVEEVEET